MTSATTSVGQFRQAAGSGTFTNDTRSELTTLLPLIVEPVAGGGELLTYVTNSSTRDFGHQPTDLEPLVAASAINS